MLFSILVCWCNIIASIIKDVPAKIDIIANILSAVSLSKFVFSLSVCITNVFAKMSCNPFLSSLKAIIANPINNVNVFI